MDRKTGAAGLAALAICESLLLSLTESNVLGAGEARAILEDAAAANHNAIPLGQRRHEPRGGGRRDRADPRRRQFGPVRLNTWRRARFVEGAPPQDRCVLGVRLAGSKESEPHKP